MLTTKDLLDGATVEILDSTGTRRLGTGTILTSDGTVLTCYHVVAGMSRVRLVRHGADQQTTDVSIDLSNASKEFDLALLKSSWMGLAPVPILRRESATGSWIANGFQDLQLGYQGAVPLAGTYRSAKLRKYTAVSPSDTGSGSRRDYVLAEALDLDGSAVHGGTSGASAVDEETSAIVGVIVGSLTNPNDPVQPHTRSIAVSVPHAASVWPPLMAVFASASSKVPCFGKALNPLGAEILCTAQRMATLQDLTVAKLIDETKLRLRDGLGAALKEFLADAAPLMPVIGESGAGKTSIAAMLSCGMGLRHGLLVRGVHMQAGDTSIAAQIERALTDDEYGTYGLDSLIRPDLPRPNAETLARVASSTGERLVIVLDAINEHDEALLPAHRIAGSWMPRTIDWLRRNNAKLIVTCRPEIWSTLLLQPLRDAVFPPPRERSRNKDEPRTGISRPPSGGLWVGDLSEQELEEMIRVYGVDQRMDPEDARHPFFLRLAAELGPLESSYPLSRVQLIDAALDHRIRDIVRRYPQDAVGISELSALITSIAAAMLSEGSDFLDAAKAVELPLATPNVLRGLIDSGVIERVGVNYRFRFDQYADAERSRLLTLPLRTKFEGIAPDFGDARLRSTIGMTAERMYSESQSGMLQYESVVGDPAPLALRVGLLIETARIGEDGYGRRVKDWEDEQHYGDRFYEWIDESWFGKALKALHAKDSATVLRLLFQHLDDERPIIGRDNREATVASLCGGCLCAIAGDDVRNYVSDLLSHRSYVATSVLEVALRRRPQALATALLQHSSQLAEHGEASTDDIKVLLSRLLTKACGLVSTEEFRASVLGVLRGWTDDAEPVSVRSVALASIRKVDPEDVAALDSIIDMLGAQSSDEDFRTGLSQLEHVPENHRDKVVQLVLARLDSMAGRWNIWNFGFAWSIFHFLERPEIRRTSALEIIKTLRRHAARVAEDDTEIARWAFLVLKDIEPLHPAWPGLFDLLEKVFEDATSRTETTFVDYAYCNLPIEGEAAERTRSILGTHKLSRDALSWAIALSIKNASKIVADDCVRMLSSLRPPDPLLWDQSLQSQIEIEPWPTETAKSQFVEAVLRYWRSLPKSELTEASRKAIGLDN
ncbi:trypsin-like peptidase domain-containing protein [Rhizobium mongolense]|uniref:serine protease n=1 Tax=Rhizobium mongolense TaxID=57676 RepID=UPI0035589725